LFISRLESFGLFGRGKSPSFIFEDKGFVGIFAFIREDGLVFFVNDELALFTDKSLFLVPLILQMNYFRI
jgi:hypothetical protein